MAVQSAVQDLELSVVHKEVIIHDFKTFKHDHSNSSILVDLGALQSSVSLKSTHAKSKPNIG